MTHLNILECMAARLHRVALAIARAKDDGWAFDEDHPDYDERGKWVRSEYYTAATAAMEELERANAEAEER